jgi:hypothetical protein
MKDPERKARKEKRRERAVIALETIARELASIRMFLDALWRKENSGLKRR